MIRIIGYGNTLRGDDGLGWVAAEKLRQHHFDTPVEIITVHQLTMDLAEPISSASLVILIDVSAATPPGQIIQRTITATDITDDTMHHHMEPEALHAYTQALYGHCPPIKLFAITSNYFDFDESRSPAVPDALLTMLAPLTELFTPSPVA